MPSYARFFRYALIPAAMISLAACATAGSQGPGSEAAVAREDTSLYGLYLAGQGALDAGDDKTAAAYFAKAQAAAPDATFLKQQVFAAALLAGDIDQAAANAPGADASAGDQAFGALVRAVQALASGKGQEASAILAQRSAADGGAAALLRPWAAAAAGRTADSLAIPIVEERLFKVIARRDQAMLFERARRYAEAETAYKALLADRLSRTLVLQDYGEFLERRGRKAEARDAYGQILAGDADDPVAQAALARMAAGGKPPPMPTIGQGASEALTAPAASLIADRQSEIGLGYLRLALKLDPGNDEAWLLAGDVLAAAGDADSARDSYARVPAKSPRYAEARARLAWSYQASNQTEMALKVARETVEQLPSSELSKLTLADVLRGAGRFEESARVLDPVIAAHGDKADWRLYYMRGVALERSGHWPEAEADLEKALKLNPNQPEVLNYLGYSWVNRGVKVKDGMAMIQRAVDAQPQEGAYVDSLGWAYYRLGQYDKAVELLERAVSLDASDTEINEHLGDAYWRVGRRTEAEFQWKAVLTLKPDEATRTRIEAKLNSPLGPDSVGKGPAVAAQ